MVQIGLIKHISFLMASVVVNPQFTQQGQQVTIVGGGQQLGGVVLGQQGASVFKPTTGTVVVGGQSTGGVVYGQTASVVGGQQVQTGLIKGKIAH